MRIDGTLTRWNDERGFGFITPTRGGPDVFVHVSAFPKDGRRPTLGERLTFDVETDSQGKARAKALHCPERPMAVYPGTARRASANRKTPGTALSRLVIPALALAGLAVYAYLEYNSETAPLLPIRSEETTLALQTTYRCDGRTHCSQMTSCEEATFFLQNCPNVEMDGNGDGVPCEQQWCTSPFAR